MHQDRAGLEDPDGLRTAAVDQRRDLGIGVDRHKTAAELITLADPDQPGVVFGAFVTAGQQLFEHDRHLHAIRRPQGIQL